MNSPSSLEEKVLKNYRHNFIVNFFDGGFFWFGYSFIAPAVILPLYVSHFTDNKFLIGLVAVISATGYFLPQLFTANWVEHLKFKKYAPVNVGFFTERVPLLILPVATYVTAGLPVLPLVLFFIFYGWHAFGAGAVAVGWNDMLAKVIPLDRRGFFLGITSFAGTTTGILGAYAAAYLLDQYGFPYGFIYCFAIAGLLILISWFFLAMVREIPSETGNKSVSQSEYWKKLPSILKKDANLQHYLISQVFIGLGGMAGGFLAVYAAQQWSLSDGKVGSFTSAMLIGQAITNLFFGVLADRKGYKIILVISSAIAVLSMVLAMLVKEANLFYLVFGLRGASFGGFFLSSLFVFEFSKAEIRPTYIGINNTTIGVTSVVAPLIGGWLANVSGYQTLFLNAIILGVVGLVILALFVYDPRSRPAQVEETPNNLA